MNYYEYTIKDLDHLDAQDQESFYNKLSNFFISTDHTDLKLFSIKNSAYIASHDEIEDFPESKLSLVSDFLNISVYQDGLKGDAVVFNNHIVVNGQYIALIDVDLGKVNTYSNYLKKFNCDYCVDIKKVGYNESRFHLIRKQNSSDQLSNTHHRNALEEKKYGQVSTLKESIEDQSDSLFNYRVTLIIRAQSLEELNLKLEDIPRVIRNTDIEVRQVCYGLSDRFHEVFLGKENRIKSRFESASYIINLIPTTKDFIHYEGVEFKSLNDNSVFINVFDPKATNPHMYISGKTGTGKSGFAGRYVLEYINHYNANAVLIDLGGGLKRVCDYVGGVDYSEKINLKLLVKDIEVFKKVICSFIGEEVLNRKEVGEIHEGILKFIDKNDYTVEALIDELREINPDYRLVFMGFEDYFYFGDELTLSKYSYIDLAKIPEVLISSYLVYIRFMAEHLDGKTFIVWDECWKLIEKSPGAIKYAIKTDRKKDVSNILINQEYDSIGSDNDLIREVIHSNVAFKVIFNQTEIKNISEENKLIVKNFVHIEKGEYSIALVVSDHFRKLIKVDFDPLYFELTMTDREEFIKQKKFLDTHTEFLDFKRGIEKWIDYKYFLGGL